MESGYLNIDAYSGTRTSAGLCAESDRWASPTVFVPRTLWRTWCTRRFPPALKDRIEICWGTYNAGGFGCIMRIVQDFCNSPGKRRFAFLLPLGLLMLSMAVFGWGLQYKLSLYQASDSISHLTPEAKLLSQKERPVARLAIDARPAEIPAFPLLPALLMVAFTPGLYQAATRYARTASKEGSRAPLPPCLQAVFLRPPPVLS
jgi:hypothetical protein